ncbi:hypothetical protein [Glycomyces arizonensis]|uniref:hypothetical protein n=1 Tax=Glycomyces arizonensis TaxID=256035 RepID=UPI0004129DE5|nr:hypothetical protein [Glycomyces arizonensis]
MLADWYFCACRRARAKDITTYLECVEILDAPSADKHSVVTALEVLSQPDKSAFAVHSVPRILALIDRPGIDRGCVEAARALLESVCSLVQNEGVRRGLLKAFNVCMESKEDYIAFRVALERVPSLEPTRLSRSTTPYADVTSHVDSACMLVLLGELAARDRSNAEDLYSNEERITALVDRARQGDCGRMSYLLAAELAVKLELDSVEAVAAEVAMAGEGAADLEPDLVGTVARLTVRDWIEEGEPRKAAERIGVEAAVGRYWDRWRRYGPEPRHAEELRRTVLARMIGDQPLLATQLKTGAVIWHHSWWWEAVHQIPREASTVLATWWSPPADAKPVPGETVAVMPGFDAAPPYKPALLNALVDIGGTAEAPVEVGSGEVAAELNAKLVSPWLRRENDLHRPVSKPDPAMGQYGQFGSHLEPVALRSLASAITAVGLLHTPGAEGREDWLDLVMHGKDVILHSCLFGALQHHRQGKKTDLLPLPMLGLSLFAEGLLNRIGQGTDPAVTPAELAGHLTDRFETDRGEDGPRARMYRRSGKRAVLYWLRLARSGGEGRYRSDRGRYWFKPVDDSPSQLVVADLVDDDAMLHRSEDPDRNERIAAELARRDIYEQLAPLGYPLEEDVSLDWFNRFDELIRLSRKKNGKGSEFPVVERRSLLAAPDYDFDTWEEDIMPRASEWEETKGWKDNGGPLILATVRLCAVLRHRADTGSREGAEWIGEWRDAVTAIKNPGEFPQSLRHYMIERILSTPWPSDPSVRDDVGEVTDLVIDAILEFSGNAVWYYDKLFTTLTGEGFRKDRDKAELDRVYSRTAKRFLALRGMEPAADRGPYELIESRNAETAARYLFNRFLSAVSERWLPGSRASLGREIADAFAEALTPEIIGRIPATDALNDRLLALGAVSDEYSGRRWLIAPKDTGADMVPVPAPGARPATVLGVLVDSRTEDGGVTARFDCGLDELVEHRLNAEDPRAPGDQFEVSLRNGRIAEVRPLVGLGRERRHGEVRPAEVAPIDDFPRLRVAVEGDPEWMLPEGDSGTATLVRNRWEPDVLRSLQGEDPWTTFVRWDADRDAWLPVERSSSELIASEFGGARTWLSSLPVVFGDMTDPEFPGRPRSWRVVVRPGETYLVRGSDWDDRSLSLLTDKADAEKADPTGLRASIQVDRRTGRISIVEGAGDDGDFDERNRRWLEFDLPEACIARFDGDRWHLPTDQFDEVPEGIPPRIGVTGMESTESTDDCLCEIESVWDERTARRAEVHGKWQKGLDGISDPQLPSEERYLALTGNERDRVVRLGRIPNARTARPFVLCGVEGSDLQVQLHSETVSLAGVETGAGWRSGFRTKRRAVVVKDGPSSTAVPTWREVPEAELHRVLGSDGDHVLREGLRRIDGCVVEPIGSDEHGRYCGVWLRIAEGRAPLYVRIPEQYLGAVNRIGDPVRIRREDHRWLVCAERRIIRARALFETADEPGEGWIRIGRSPTVGRPRELLQDPHRPVVAWRGAAGAGETAFAGAELRQSGKETWSEEGTKYLNVQATDRRRKAAFFSRARQRYLGGHVVVDHIELRETRIDGMVLLRSEIVSRPAGGGGRRAGRIQPPGTESAHDAWKALLEENDDHLVGTLGKGGTLFVPPVDTLVPQPEGGFGDTLPLKPGTRPPVLVKNGFPESHVRVRVVPYRRGYAASFDVNDVKPLTADEMSETLNRLGKVSKNGKTWFGNRPVFYLGRKTVKGREFHQFCWGLGWVADVAADRLLVAGKPVTVNSTALFHGDRVRAAVFKRTEDPEKTSVQIWPSDITHYLASQIYEESRLGIVHEALVDIDESSGRAVVRCIRLRDLRSGRPEGLEKRLHGRARIGEKSISALFEHYWHRVEAGDTDNRFWVNVRADREVIKDSQGEVLGFEYVPPVLSSTPDGNGLRVGDHLYLEVTDVHRQPNDLLLEFGLPHEVRSDPDSALHVAVSRRRYSIQHDALRRELERHGGSNSHLNGVSNGGLNGVRMLVKLTKAPRNPQTANRWEGATNDPPMRELSTLLSFLQHQGGAYNAFLGQTKIELRPGLLWSTKSIAGLKGIPHGSVVRLAPDGKRIVASQAVPAEQEYLSAQRPLILLPMNPLKNVDLSDVPKVEKGYTAAGFPGVRLLVRPDAVDLLAVGHPKLGAVGEAGTDRVVVKPVARLDRAVAAKVGDGREGGDAVPLELRGDGAAHETAAPEVAWSQLAFREGSRADLWQACRHANWRYHDLKTFDRTRESSEREYYIARQGGHRLTVMDEPVFFHEEQGRLTLRYPQDRLARFGYPVNELLMGMRRNQERRFTVAGPTSAPSKTGGLWVEVSPGRIFEVPGSILTASSGGDALGDRVEWAAFGPGDSVWLKAIAEPGELGRLELLDWAPNLRSAMSGASRRMLLDVTGADHKRGCLYLGTVDRPVRYPVGPRELMKYREEPAVWLGRDNTLASASGSGPAPDDTVLLGLDGEGEFRVLGLPDASVELSEADSRTWPFAEWLHRALADPVLRADVIAGCGGGLPVTVEACEDGAVTVSRRLQPSSRWPKGPSKTLMFGQAKAHLGGGQLIVSQGSVLRQLPIGGLVHGLEGEDIALVAERLPETGNLWWRSAPGKSEPGSAEPRWGWRPEIEVEIVDGVDRGGKCAGLLCRDVLTKALHWMPVGQAAWTQDLDAKALRNCLGERITVALRPNLSVSIVDRIGAKRQFADLSLGSRFGATLRSQHGTSKWLATTEPFGIPLLFKPRGRGVVPGEQCEVEVENYAAVPDRSVDGGMRRTVRAVFSGTRTAFIDLPRWMRSAIAHREEDKSGLPDVVLHKRYADLVGGSISYQDATDSTARLLHAAGLILRSEPVLDPPALLREWMREHGRASFDLKATAEPDLAPMLAAVLVCDAAEAEDQSLTGTAVLMAYFLGVAATRALHTEPIVTEWLASPGGVLEGPRGLWQRLRESIPNGSGDKGLKGEERRQIAACCRAILLRHTEVRDDASIGAVARGITAALGRPEDAEATVVRDAGILGPLSAFARVLHPRSRPAPCQTSLTDDQRKVLRLSMAQLAEFPFITPPMRHLHLPQDLVKVLLDRFSESVESGPRADLP